MELFNQNQDPEPERAKKSPETLPANATSSSALLSQLPISHEVSFPVTSSHSRAITSIALDKHSGTQLLTGSSGDYVVKIWDMNTMNKQLRPTKEFKPFPGHQIRALSFSPDQNASMFLCCCANNQARLYSRDGTKLKTTVRGDMYIQDMANTKGHVASITGGMFHPKDAEVFLTSSLDGSVR